MVLSLSAQNYGHYIFISWLPAYFHDAGIGVSDSGLLSVAPYIVMFAFDNLWGHIIDGIISSGRLSRLAGRRVSQVQPRQLSGCRVVQ